ncbi:Putative transcriptional regulatory protein C3C7.04 [Fusarium odoratissimum]|uniref:Putative transcriptional regulatory protein C3C7.04 n=1 Tax=Fusarium oxysporum f. sp. cubense (strain race 4) TaxID=2502994 RepID=N1RP18_FUSC4|nr:Putative transcriptional regulatory protein C3C7.04 [Fusarium odoratissimum]
MGALQGQAAEVPLPVNLHNLASEPWIQHPRLDVAAVDALPKRTENVRLERKLGRANALSRVQAFVKDVKRVSLVVALTDRLSPRQSQSPMPAGDATITAVAASSQTGATPQENISIESHQTEGILWPRFLTRLREAFSLDPISGPEEQDMVNLQANITRPNNPSLAEQVRLKKIVDSFPPRSIAEFLVHVCIRRGTDVFFYFDQSQLIHEIEQFYTNQTCPLRFDPSFICLALTIFALGSHWTPLERPGHSRIDEHDPGRLFFEQAKVLVPDIIELPGLRSIQVCLILGVYLMPQNAVGSSYVYTGMALRKALAFDLHQDLDDQAMDAREREVRRRLWWSIYSLERCSTIKLNRPRSVAPEIITVPLPTVMPEFDDSQKFNNVLLQIAFARLISILDRVADWESTVTSDSGRADTSSLENQLREWKDSLPGDFDLETIPPQDSRYRAVFHIWLNYYYAWIVMGKMSLITLVRMTLRRHLGDNPEPCNIDEKAEKLSKSCAKASKKLLQLFEDLNQTGYTTRFSFTDFQGCSIATIVTLIAGILDRDPGYERRVRFGLDFLRRMATGNPNAQVAIGEGALGADQNTQVPPGADAEFWSTGPEVMEWSSRTDAVLEPLMSRLPVPQLQAGDQLDPFETYRLSTTYNDDQPFLMGLTGFDVLDFAGYPPDMAP